MADRTLIIAAAVNDESILADTLARSPDLTSGRAAFIPVREAKSASLAYNSVLATTTADLVAFVHQDIYVPNGWVSRVLDAAKKLDREAPNWAVLGVYGITHDGGHLGRVWSGDQQVELAGAAGAAGEVASLDEIVIILRTEAGLRFDPALPHFHLYGTDIVQIAALAGRGAHVIAVPVIHNAVPVASLGGGFAAAYAYLQKKWAARLPITTSMTTITRSGMPLLRARLRHWWYDRKVRGSGLQPLRVTDVAALAKSLNYES